MKIRKLKVGLYLSILFAAVFVAISATSIALAQSDQSSSDATTSSGTPAPADQTQSQGTVANKNSPCKYDTDRFHPCINPPRSAATDQHMAATVGARGFPTLAQSHGCVPCWEARVRMWQRTNGNVGTATGVTPSASGPSNQ